jgi:uncharacterized coiled-coil protein SlyX
MFKKLLIGSVVLATTLSLQANELDELNAKLDALTEEIATLKEKQENGGSSTMDKVSIGGYGKMDYTHYKDNPSDKADQTDIYRAIMYFGYAFTDNIKFFSEIEWEHGGREKTGGYGIVEQAYLDLALTDNSAIKLGHMIVPVGMVNIYHEPTAFYTVSRPEVEKYIVPSTWHENGAIVYGKVNNFDYNVGIMTGLNAGDGAEVRSMRQSGQKADADDFAFVARGDYQNKGFYVGASLFTGGAGQHNSALDGVNTTIAEVHAGYSLNRIHVNALYAQSKVSDANKVAVANAENASGKGAGYYVNVAYDVTPKWAPFVQYENYNRFDEKYDATGASIASDKEITNTTIGVNYKPVPNVVLKANYVSRDNKGTSDDMIQLGTGYDF